MHVNNSKLYYEIVISKGRGILSRKAEKMIEILGTEAIRKKSYKYREDKYDCLQSGLLDMYQNWYKFNSRKSDNAFAYLTEVFKRGIAKGWNEIHKKKGDKDNNIAVYSIDSSNDGNGLHSL